MNIKIDGYKLAGQIVAFIIVCLILLWYNHVFIQLKIPWWALGLISAVWIFAVIQYKWIKPLIAVLCITAMVSQILAWCDIIKLPIFK